MADRLVMAYWDCPYCNTKKIKGTDQVCPNCAHQRDKDIKCYMDQGNIEYLSEEEAKNKGKGADWICPYCDSLNSIQDTTCIACGAPKEEAKFDYFHREEKPQPVSQTPPPAPKKPQTPSKPAKKKSRAPIFALILLLAIGGIFMALKPHKTVFIANAVNWFTTVEVEAYETVEESDWSIPAGGREKSHKKEIYSYNHVIDHYETVQKTRRVKIGTHTEYKYEDNGDGTFREVPYSVDDYGDETYEEEEPVYVDVPVYKTKYYYEIDKWIPKRKVENTGSDAQPVYKDPELASNERESGRNVSYKVTGCLADKEDKIVTIEVSENMWKKFLSNNRQNCEANRLGNITFPEEE